MGGAPRIPCPCQTPSVLGDTLPCMATSLHCLPLTLPQAFLSGISTVPGTGLGSEYFNTPSKYMGYSFLLVCALITAAFFVQH